MPHVGMPAKSVDRGGHGKWVVDTDQGRDHEQVRQGVCEGVEEGQEAGILDEVWLSRPGAGTTPSARRAARTPPRWTNRRIPENRIRLA